MLPESARNVLSALVAPVSEPKELAIIPPICGVYLLILGDDVVYVGQSIDVVARVNNHVNERKKQFDRAVYFECHEGHLKEVEWAFILKLKPRYNRGIQPGSNGDYRVVRDTAEKIVGWVLAAGPGGVGVHEMPFIVLGESERAAIREVCRDPRVRWNQSRAAFVPA